MYVSKPTAEYPKEYKSELQKNIYETLKKLDINFERVECSGAVTMEECADIDKALSMQTVKTLLLCNRQKTQFYMFVTDGSKPFVTKNFSRALGISRVSFAPVESLMDICNTTVGATTVLSLIREECKCVNLVFDREIIEREYYGCTDSTTTCYMKIKTVDIINKFIPNIKKEYNVIDITDCQ